MWLLSTLSFVAFIVVFLQAPWLMAAVAVFSLLAGGISALLRR